MCGRRTNSGTDSTDNTCRTNDLNDMHLSESDTLGVTNQGYNTNPPAYDSVAIVKLDESALPPTYAIVTAHPSEFSVCVA